MRSRGPWSEIDSSVRRETTRQPFGARAESLTPREREVFDLVVSGLMNKQVAAQLGISEHTVKVHRGRIMKKMCAGSLAKLVGMAHRLVSLDSN